MIKKFIAFGVVALSLMMFGCGDKDKTNEVVGSSTYEIASLIDSSGNLTSPISTTTLVTSGATTLGSTLAVTGTSVFTGLITANGGVTLGAGDDLIGSSTSDITINSTAFTVAGATGNTTVGGTLVTTGLITANGGVTLGAGDDLIGSATSDITINTDKFTVAGATGNTVVAGTFGITAGDATLTAGDLILTAGRVNTGVNAGLTCSSGLVIDLATTTEGVIPTTGETNTACAISFTNGTAGEVVYLSHDYNGTGIITFADVTGFDASFTPVTALCTGVDAGVTAANDDHFYLQGVMTSATEIMITGCVYFDAA